jgi:hypothetical protein
MIDVENIVYTNVSDAIRNAFPNCECSGTYAATPPSFPFASIVEEDNYVYRESQDENIENDVRVMYAINVYSNKLGTNKSEAKKILAVADEAFGKLNFTRTMRSQIPNEDRTIYRLIARYEGVVHKGITEDGTTTFYVYRN